jgi:hypothetical protein
MGEDGELESVGPPDINQTAQRSVHGDRIPPIGLLATDYLTSGTPDTGYTFRCATNSINVTIRPAKPMWAIGCVGPPTP